VSTASVLREDRVGRKYRLRVREHNSAQWANPGFAWHVPRGHLWAAHDAGGCYYFEGLIVRKERQVEVRKLDRHSTGTFLCTTRATRHATCHIPHTTERVQHASCIMHHATCNMQHVTCNMIHVTCKMHRATCNLARATCDARRRSLPMRLRCLERTRCTSPSVNVARGAI
jgi:hypothetical protein